MWANGDSLRLAAERPNHWGSDPVIALDYHQVLDVDRSVNPPGRVDHVGNLPAGHVAAVRRLRKEMVGLRCRVKAKVIVLSHIHDSVVNERNLITAVQQSSLSVDCVIVTRERTGPGGKFEVLRSLTRGQAVILGDNIEVLQEFSEASLIAVQLRKPRVAAIFGEEQSLGACQHLGWLIDWCDSCITVRLLLRSEIASKPLLSGCSKGRGALFARPVPESACANRAFVPVKRKRRLGVVVLLAGLRAIFTVECQFRYYCWWFGSCC